MDSQQSRRVIREEVVRTLQQDPAAKQAVLDLTRRDYANKDETSDRFDQLLEELRQEREAQTHKWEEQNRKWDEQNRKWDENQRAINDAIKAIQRRHDNAIGALGARWGMQTEEAFRSALQGILVETFGVQVVNVNEFDDAGEVFGRPDQVEIDLIIKNGLLILCEIKSSMSRSDMYIFDRKAQFYTRRHGQQADRRLVISPMVDRHARRVAKELGIEVFSYAEDVDL